MTAFVFLHVGAPPIYSAASENLRLVVCVCVQASQVFSCMYDGTSHRVSWQEFAVNPLIKVVSAEGQWWTLDSAICIKVLPEALQGHTAKWPRQSSTSLQYNLDKG